MVWELLDINFMAVLMAALANFLLGLLWYSPFVVGCAWMVQMNLKGEDIDKLKGRIPIKSLGSFVCAYISAVMMTILIKVMGASNLISGINLGLMIAVGFVLTSILNNNFFEDRPIKLFLITAGHYLLVFTVMGAILGAWS